MSNIRVDLGTPIKNGMEVVFRSPVDCSQVTGLIVYYNGGSQEFMFADAHGENVGIIDHLFAENVAVKVILDVTTGMAFVQNADTNTYLEGRFAKLEQADTGIRDRISIVEQNIASTDRKVYELETSTNDRFATVEGEVDTIQEDAERLEQRTGVLEKGISNLTNNVGDIYNTVGEQGENISAIKREIAPHSIICNPSGTVIPISDQSILPLRGVKLFGKTKQSTTPTPDAPVAFEHAGGSKENIEVKMTGKNLLFGVPYESTSQSLTFAYSNNIATFKGTSTKNVGISECNPNSEFLLPAGTYTLSLNRTSGSGTVSVISYGLKTGTGYGSWILGGKAYNEYTSGSAQKRTFTLTNDTRVWFYVAGGNGTYNHTFSFQLECGTNSTAFEPYQAQSPITIDNYGGLKGITGGGCDEIDFGKAKYVKRIIERTFDSSDIFSSTDYNFANNYNNFNPKPKLNTPVMCSHATGVTINAGGNLLIPRTQFTSMGIEDETAFAAWVAEQSTTDNPFVIYYEAETPVEESLPIAAQATYNNWKPYDTTSVFMSEPSVEMQVEYVADTKKYIDNKFNELATAIVALG